MRSRLMIAAAILAAGAAVAATGLVADVPMMASSAPASEATLAAPDPYLDESDVLTTAAETCQRCGRRNECRSGPSCTNCGGRTDCWCIICNGKAGCFFLSLPPC